MTLQDISSWWTSALSRFGVHCNDVSRPPTVAANWTSLSVLVIKFDKTRFCHVHLCSGFLASHLTLKRARARERAHTSSSCDSLIPSLRGTSTYISLSLSCVPFTLSLIHSFISLWHRERWRHLLLRQDEEGKSELSVCRTRHRKYSI